MIIALIAISLLTVAVLEASRSVGLFEKVVNTTAMELQTRYLARSGLGLLQALLEEDGTSVDSFKDDWAMVNTMGSVPVADMGWAIARIDDEEGKLDINRLINSSGELDLFMYERIYQTLYNIGLSEDRALEITDSLVDWIDEDADVTGSGAESSYYSSLPNPYSCADDYLASIEEVALVAGVGEELLNTGEGDVPPLRRFFTVNGDSSGRININTAPVEIIMSLTPEGMEGVNYIIDRDLAEEILSTREDYEFEKATQLKERVVDFHQDLFSQVAGLIDTTSSHFSASVVGESQYASSRAYGVFFRNEGSVRLVYYRGF